MEVGSISKFSIIDDFEPHLGKFEGFAKLELDIDVTNMKDGGPKLFAVAVKALKKIVAEVTE